MEDSLEDYLLISKNKIDTKDKNKKDIPNEILLSAQKKKDCEDRALKIVELLIEGKLRSPVFLKSISYIDESFYKDIIEERAITKLCGYPLCGKRIPEMSKKQYSICTNDNKVYDITDRKKYCSNFCYKASIHIMKQIDNSPLWSRDFTTIPTFDLLSNSEDGLKGVEVDQGTVKSEKDASFTSVSSFTELSLDVMVEHEYKSKKSSRSNKAKNFSMEPLLESEEESTDTEKENYDNIDKVVRKKSYKKIITNKEISAVRKNSMEPILENDEIEIEDNTTSKIVIKSNENNIKENFKNFKNSSKTDEIKTDVKIKSDILKTSKSRDKFQDYDKLNEITKKIKNKSKKSGAKLVNLNDIKEINDKIKRIKLASSNFVDDVLDTGSEKTKNSILDRNILKHATDIEIQIRKVVSDWLSLETFIFIHGEEKVKKVLSENKIGHYFDILRVQELELPQQQKYMEICKRLNMQELAEDKFESACLSGGTVLKPPPNFKELKDESKKLDLKVKAFYEGMLYESDNSNFPTSMQEEEDENPAVLPLGDVNSQKALRRNIFLDSLNKGMNRVLQYLQIHSINVLEDMQSLAKSFNLKADNIVFKSSVWNYIALIILHIISYKNEELNTILRSESCTELVRQMIDIFPNKDSIIIETWKILENMEDFVMNYVSKI